MEKYTCEYIDFELVDKYMQIINNSKRDAEFKDLNNKIDLDFLNQSDLIENIKSKMPVKDLLQDPNIKVLRMYPSLAVKTNNLKSGHTDNILYNYNDVDTDEIEKYRVDRLKDTRLVIFNADTGDEVTIHTSGHLVAIDNTLREARNARRDAKAGIKRPLTDVFILDVINCNILGLDIAQYRSKYFCSSISVEGAKWTPVRGERVDERMTELLNWYNNETELHPLIRAAILHAEFIKIHPFPDGNGRTARLLVNYELVKNAYPTITIKAKNKRQYIEALEDAVMNHDVTKLVKMFKKCMLLREEFYLRHFEQQEIAEPQR